MNLLNVLQLLGMAGIAPGSLARFLRSLSASGAFAAPAAIQRKGRRSCLRFTGDQFGDRSRSCPRWWRRVPKRRSLPLRHCHSEKQRDPQQTNRGYHLIFAKDADNVTLRGGGTIDGQGPSFWVPSGRKNQTQDEHWGDVESLYLKHRQEVSPLLKFVNCNHLRWSNSTIYNSAESDVNARVISGICLEMVDGGWLDGVVITGIRMQRTRTPIFLRLGAWTDPRADTRTDMPGIMISDIQATEAVLTSSMTGLPGMEVEDVTLSSIPIETQEPGLRECTDREIPEVPKAYLEARMFGRLPAYGMYARHAKGIRMHKVVFESSGTEQRPAVVCDDVTSLEIAGLRVPRQGNESSVIELRQTTDAWIRDGRAGSDAPSLVHVNGADSARILVSSCDLRGAKQPLTFAADAAPDSVTLANNITRETSTHPPTDAQR